MDTLTSVKQVNVKLTNHVLISLCDSVTFFVVHCALNTNNILLHSLCRNPLLFMCKIVGMPTVISTCHQLPVTGRGFLQWSEKWSFDLAVAFPCLPKPPSCPITLCQTAKQHIMQRHWCFSDKETQHSQIHKLLKAMNFVLFNQKAFKMVHGDINMLTSV